MTDFKKEIIGKLLTGQLEIIQCETNNPVEVVPSLHGYHSCYPGTKTITLTCKFNTPNLDRIKELEEENCKLREKLNSINEVLNPSQEGFPDEYYEGQ